MELTVNVFVDGKKINIVMEDGGSGESTAAGENELYIDLVKYSVFTKWRSPFLKIFRVCSIFCKLLVIFKIRYNYLLKICILSYFVSIFVKNR